MQTRRAMIENNAKGLMLLSHQRFEESARIFRSCLGELHSQLEGSMGNPNRDNTVPKSSLPYNIIPANVCSESVTDQSALTLYVKGFYVVPKNEQMDDDLSYEDEHLLSAVFLYNLTLTFHLRALVSPSTKNVNLKRSLALYEMILKFFRCLSETEDAAASILQLAVFNNMAYIHLHNYDAGAFGTKVAWMKEILWTQTAADDEYNVFCLNLVMTEHSNCFCLSPAA